MTAALAYNPKTGDYDVQERVLVFPANRITGFEQDAPEGILTNKDRMGVYLKKIMGSLTFMDRDLAENDPSFKQVIPYVILMQGRMVLRYKRTKKGGENRLHEKYSIGIGGHINPADGEATSRNTYWRGFRREVEEEVSVSLPWDESPSPIVALLYDHKEKATPEKPVPVGHVHFGIVHIVKLPVNAKIEFNDPALAEGEFHHALELKHADVNFEEWSRLVVKNVL